MLVRNLAVLLCSSAASLAFKIAVPDRNSVLKPLYDYSRDQIHLGAHEAQEAIPWAVDESFDSEAQWPHPPKGDSEERTIYQVLSDSDQ